MAPHWGVMVEENDVCGRLLVCRSGRPVRNLHGVIPPGATETRVQWPASAEEGVMATVTKGWTSADLADVPEDQTGRRYEIIDGELIVTPSPVPRHELLAVRLTLRFGNYVEARRLGQVWGDRVDIKLAEGEALVIPDLSFIRRDRLGIVGPTAIDGVPDLVLEILSPSTRHRDLGEKMALYARYGVTEYWVVDPEARSVRVLILNGDRYEAVEQPPGLARSRVLPGLDVDIAALFAELD